MNKRQQIEYDLNHPFSRAWARYQCRIEDEIPAREAFILTIEERDRIAREEERERIVTDIRSLKFIPTRDEAISVVRKPLTKDNK